MGLYALTYMNGGGDKSIREANFDSELDANKFADQYNSTNDSARIIKISKVVSLMSEKKKAEFLKKSFNRNNCIDLKVMYRTTKNKLFNMTIAFLDKSYTESKLDALMSYVNDFSKREDNSYKATKQF